ncbi:MAG: DUF4870 domain-containing protein [Deltaproteobacteria bacterium]|nr:DUF4870 domain-containing protein [Deltaproteobacteria bacterium]
MTGAPNQTPTQSSGLDPHLASALCYLCGWLTGLIFLLIEKDNKTVKFHAWHSIFLSVACIAYFLISTVLSLVPFVGIVFGILNVFVSLGLLVLIVVLIVKAYQGTRFVLPVITELAEKQAQK